MQENHEGKAIVSTKTMDIAVAAFFLVFGAVVMWDSHRIGSGWSADGPESGAFPFYIGLFIVLSCVVTIVNSIKDKEPSEGFVEAEQLKMILQVLIPTIVYVVASTYIGIYVASAIFITAFMIILGKFSIVKSGSIGICVPVALFMMFEIWFKVPLPKGPLEAALGF